MLLSILIPTLESRAETFFKLFQKLSRQVESLELEREVEILVLKDGGHLSIGRKRNLLLERATGLFVVFVDDDDDVSDEYLRLISSALHRHPDCDCVGFKARVTFRGRHPHPMIYSLRYDQPRTDRGIYLRPPQHITPVRRQIAARYRFADTSHSEDYDWALQLRADKALKTEHFIDQELYTYYSRRSWVYQWSLDRTEALRHRLGLRLVNRVRMKRWFARQSTGRRGNLHASK